MTALGALFAALIVVGLFRRTLFPWVLALSAAFPYSAAVTIAGNSIIPFHLVAAIACVLLIFEAPDERHGAARPGLSALLLFLGWSLFITVAGPFLFAGEPVLNPRTGIDLAVRAQEPLQYTISMFAQAGYLVLTVGAVLYLARRRFSLWLAMLPFVVATVLGAINWAMVAVGLTWPSWFFDTSHNVIYSHRMRGGIFNEPSQFGGFAVAALALFAVAAMQTRGWSRGALTGLAALAALNIVNSEAGTALGGLAIILAIGAATALWRVVAAGRGAPLIVFGAGGVALVMLLAGDTVLSWGEKILGGKIGSASMDVRTSSDAFSVELLWQTWGLGVGLGANRPSSFATMLVSCVGVLGTVAFAILIFQLVARARLHPLGAAPVWGLLAFLAAKAVSLPDLATPGMWILIAACAQIAWALPSSSPEITTPDRALARPENGTSDGIERHVPDFAEEVGADPYAGTGGGRRRPGGDLPHQTSVRRDRAALRRDPGQ